MRLNWQQLMMTLVVSATFAPTCAASDTGPVGRISALMKQYGVPGGSLCVVKDGKVQHCACLGYADLEQSKAVEIDSVFRIASISKPITSAALMVLVQEGKLGLDEVWQESLDTSEQPISLRNLLDMTAGFDERKTGNPLVRPILFKAHRSVGGTEKGTPAGYADLLSYMLRRGQRYKPGTKHIYSNFSYCILGEVISKAANEPYKEYVQNRLAKPIGVAILPAATTLDKRWPHEVKYYPVRGDRKERDFFTGRKVSSPYARMVLEDGTASVGWASTARDLALFIDRTFAGSGPLKTSSIEKLLERPVIPQWAGSTKYFAGGWEVRTTPQGKTLYKDGALPGTRSFVKRRADGTTWVALFNARPRWSPKKTDPFASAVEVAMDELAHEPPPERN